MPANSQGVVNHNTPPQSRTGKPSGAVGTTPGSGRPPQIRRGTSDAAPSGNPFGIGATPPQLGRRRTDLREGEDKDGGRAFFVGRWGSVADDDSKDKDEPPLSAGGPRNPGLFRRGSAAWGGGSSAGGFSTSALNSPMGSFGNGAFPGGAMGGFSLGDKAKKPSSTVLPKVEDTERHDQENTAEQIAAAALDNPSEEEEEERRRPMTSDTDPYGNSGEHDEHMSHSPLPTPGIGQQRIKTPFDNVAPGSGVATRGGPNPIGTPTKTRNDLGFSTFGPREVGSLGSMGLHQQLQNLQLHQQQGIPLHGRSREGSIGGMMAGDNEPLSPTETNPYQSPAPEKADEEEMGHDGIEGGGGLGSVIAGLKKGNGSGIGAEGSDRSGRSSVAGLGTGGLGGFGSLGGGSLWGGVAQVGTPGTLGTSMAPGGSAFFSSGLGDVNSPGGLLSGGMGGLGFGGGGAFGSAGRASRLGQLFPENQMQSDESQGFEPNEPFGGMGGAGMGGFGSRRAFGGVTDSPMRDRGDVADLFGFPTQRSLGNIGATAASQDPMFGRDRDDPLGLNQLSQQDQLGQQNASTPGPLNSLGQPLRPPPGTVPPTSGQQHVMVMPDKIMWVYRDPQGTIQGPFSGLEMHDWYRAGFFQAELNVKRVEDTDFDPLGTLVRKIGNTREPFLVPLPGSQPAGKSVADVVANWSGSAWLNDIPGSQATTPAVATSSTQPGAVQPPFAGSFPTFGTTLTAEQQNALERRKQEEQYLMAKQREYLVQQQVLAKQVSMTAQLHHQHSAQSLHSQPSFGSLHSPGGFPAANPAAAASAAISGQNSFEPGALLRQAGAAAGGGGDVFSQQQLGTMQVQGQNQIPSQFSPPQDSAAQLQQRMAEQQRQSLQRSYQSQQQQQAEKQLQQAREQAQAQAAQVQQQQDYDERRQDDDHYDYHQSPSAELAHEEQYQQEEQEQQQWEPEPMSRSPAPPAQPKVKIPQTQSPAPKQSSAWGGVPAPLVQPFPPAHGSQQQHEGVPVASSPSLDTPSGSSVAPWAKESANEALKTPSLKEIQELEAKQAAVKEAEAQARARTMAQQQTTQEVPPPAPGLPSTATWATSPSTTPAAGGASAWNKPLQKTSVTPVGGRKTLQQIQKEEEARKAKAAAVAAASSIVNSPNPAMSAAGKRYADLASKAAQQQQQQQQMVGGGWTTVGAGGKSKNSGGAPTPTPSVATPVVPTAPRSLGSGVALGLASPARKAVPTAPKATVQQNSREQAQTEFVKWCKGSFKDLKPGVNRQSPSLSFSRLPAPPLVPTIL